MRPFLEYIRISFSQSIQYRVELFVWIFLTLANLLILLLAWSNILSTTGDVNGFSFAGIVQYYFIVTAIDNLTASHFEDWRSLEVRDGRVDTLMTKPINYPIQILIQDIGGKLFWFITSMPVLLGALLIMVSASLIAGIQLELVNVLTVIPVLAFGYWIQFCIALMIVFTTFWLEGAEGLQHFKWIVISIFSGLMIPIPFMPDWLQHLVNILPFKYLFAVPAGIIQGSWQMTAIDWLYMLFVAGLVTILTKFVWQKTKLHYASAGG